MTPTIRPAEPRDAEAIAALCEQASHRLESYRDPFYATGPEHAVWLRASVDRLLGSQDAIALVHEGSNGRDALLLGRLAGAPPVYDPGGRVLLVEHCAVDDERGWKRVGSDLVQEAEHKAREKGGVLLRFECRTEERAKARLLASLGYSVATDWLYRDLDDVHAPERRLGIEEARPDDVSAMVGLFEAARLRYQRYQPVLWRKAPLSAQRQEEYLRTLVGRDGHLLLVHRAAGAVDGALVADLRGSDPQFGVRGAFAYVDDFFVAGEAWSTVGEALLAETEERARPLGARFAQVVCPRGEKGKGAMLRRMGYRVGHEWLVRAV